MIAFCLHVAIGKHKSVKVHNWSITEKHVKIPKIIFPLTATAGSLCKAEMVCAPLWAFNVMSWVSNYNFFQVKFMREFIHLQQQLGFCVRLGLLNIAVFIQVSMCVLAA